MKSIISIFVLGLISVLSFTSCVQLTKEEFNLKPITSTQYNVLNTLLEVKAEEEKIQSFGLDTTSQKLWIRCFPEKEQEIVAIKNYLEVHQILSVGVISDLFEPILESDTTAVLDTISEIQEEIAPTMPQQVETDSISKPLEVNQNDQSSDSLNLQESFQQ